MHAMIGSYDAAQEVCPVHGTPVWYQVGRRFDPTGEVGCQDPNCTAIAERDRMMDEVLSTGRTSVADVEIDWTRR